jgi:hypothetical protein
MRLFRCCCGWSYVIGRKKVYGPIYPMGIGTYPGALANTQRMMTREQFAENYADCDACASRQHGNHGHTQDTGPDDPEQAA